MVISKTVTNIILWLCLCFSQLVCSDTDWVLDKVNILPMSGSGPDILQNRAVFISGDKISKIVASSDLEKENTNQLKVIDGKGNYLLPGLIDAHVHIWDEAELNAYLAHGITLVRNASGMPFHLEFSKNINDGLLLGPELITTGPILNGQGPNTQVNHQIVNNGEEARAAVRQQYQQGYRHLKVYSNLSKQSYAAIKDESQKLNMTLMGHTPEGSRDAGIPESKPFNIPFTDILGDNFVSIEHVESIVFHALSDELDESKMRDLAKKIAESKTVVTPTLVAHHNLIRVAESKGAYLKREGVEYLNPFVSMMEQESFEFWSSYDPQARLEYDEFYRRATKILFDEGVTLLAGTDAGIFTNIPGLSLIDELKLLVASGLTPYQAIQTATTNPTRALGFENKHGNIAETYHANMILIEKNPLEKIENLTSISGLVLNGKWYDAESIKKLKNDASQTSVERTQQRIMDGLAAQGSSL